jgi:hypothetical protein
VQLSVVFKLLLHLSLDTHPFHVVGLAEWIVILKWREF